MPSRKISGDSFSPDIVEFARLLHGHRVRFLIVGGESVIFHGYPRLTGDIDFFYERTETNAGRMWRALEAFWQGDIPGIADKSELLEPGVIIQFVRPPHRIDLLNDIEHLDG